MVFAPMRAASIIPDEIEPALKSPNHATIGGDRASFDLIGGDSAVLDEGAADATLHQDGICKKASCLDVVAINDVRSYRSRANSPG